MLIAFNENYKYCFKAKQVTQFKVLPSKQVTVLQMLTRHCELDCLITGK